MAYHDMNNYSSVALEPRAPGSREVIVAPACGEEIEGREVALYLALPQGEDFVTLTEREAKSLLLSIKIALDTRPSSIRYATKHRYI